MRWKGYGPEHDTFEPETGLRNAFSKLREYKASLAPAKLAIESPPVNAT